MIREVRANGFRSLENFRMKVRPGLNVLVGPNGGGKTNILALFSFISALAGEELGDAISASGGASKVFRKLGQATFVKELSIRVVGRIDQENIRYLPANYVRRLTEHNFEAIEYEWDCVIDSSRGYDETVYRSQNLKVKVVAPSLLDEVSPEKTYWDFELSSRSLQDAGIEFDERINRESAAAIVHQSAMDEEGNFFSVDEDSGYDALKLPLFYVYQRAWLLRQINLDFRSGASFNFDPAICKLPSDSSQSPVLERNGRGLAATIYGLQKAQTPSYRPRLHFRTRPFDPKIFRTLVEYFKLVNESVTGLRAVNNVFDNKITVSVSISGKPPTTVDFPLELASDGTVKWLAFAAAVLTNTGGFSIEEPENFLHPDIQRQAVELVRSETQLSEHLFVLMTTHSESLLNAAFPEELIVVSMSDGITAAKRFDNPDLLDEEIKRTGFGLGYYYVSGALYD